MRLFICFGVGYFSIPKNSIEKKNTIFFKNKMFCYYINNNLLNNQLNIKNKILKVIKNEKIRLKIENIIKKNFKTDGIKNVANLIKRFK